jgi:hypothetical protein
MKNIMKNIVLVSVMMFSFANKNVQAMEESNVSKIIDGWTHEGTTLLNNVAGVLGHSDKGVMKPDVLLRNGQYKIGDFKHVTEALFGNSGVFSRLNLDEGKKDIAKNVLQVIDMLFLDNQDGKNAGLTPFGDFYASMFLLHGKIFLSITDKGTDPVSVFCAKLARDINSDKVFASSVINSINSVLSRSNVNDVQKKVQPKQNVMPGTIKNSTKMTAVKVLSFLGGLTYAGLVTYNIATGSDQDSYKTIDPVTGQIDVFNTAIDVSTQYAFAAGIMAGVPPTVEFIGNKVKQMKNGVCTLLSGLCKRKSE